MKFTAKPSSSVKQFTAASELLNKELYNCYVEDDRLLSRRGVRAAGDEVIFRTDSNSEFEMDFALTECYIYADGKYGRVAYSTSDNLMGCITYSIFLIFTDATKKNLGQLEFTAANEGVFGYPDTMIFFSGKAQKGSGIFLLLRKSYGDTLPDAVFIMEYDEEGDIWRNITESEIYAPTVLANGRGEAYHYAENQGEPLKLPTPVLPEGRNLMGSRFKAYYTTDGASNGFSLPYTELDSSSVTAELTLGAKSYLLRIEASDIKSGEVEINGTKVVMYCDRAYGRIYFEKAEGGEWIAEYTGAYNNLCVTAYKTDEAGIMTVGRMKKGITVQGGASGKQGDATAFYGSLEDTATVIFNSPRQPLYFSEKAVRNLGNIGNGIKRLLIKDRYLLAFKDNEVYSAEIKGSSGEGAQITSTGAVKSDDGYILSFEKLSDLPAKPEEKTLVCYGDAIVFFSADGTFWELSGRISSSLTAKRITKTEQYTSGMFPVRVENMLLYISLDKALAVQKQGEYLIGSWSLPQKAVAAVSEQNETLLMLEYRGDGVYIIYPAVFDGAKDLTLSSNGEEKSERDIPLKIRFRVFESDGSKKRLFKLSAKGKGSDLTARLYDNGRLLYKRKTGFKNADAQFLFGGLSDDFVAELEADKPTVLSGIAVDYKRK